MASPLGITAPVPIEGVLLPIPIMLRYCIRKDGHATLILGPL